MEFIRNLPNSTRCQETLGSRDIRPTLAYLPIFNSPLRDTNMNWNRIEGDWKQFKGDIKVRWGKLTDDQLDVIAGKRDILAGKVQELYGLSKDEAEKQLSEWQERQKEGNRPQ